MTAERSCVSATHLRWGLVRLDSSFHSHEPDERPRAREVYTALMRMGDNDTATAAVPQRRRPASAAARSARHRRPGSAAFVSAAAASSAGSRHRPRSAPAARSRAQQLPSSPLPGYVILHSHLPYSPAEVRAPSCVCFCAVWLCSWDDIVRCRETTPLTPSARR